MWWKGVWDGKKRIFGTLATVIELEEGLVVHINWMLF